MPVTWPDNLVHAVARRRAVILIGSGVSANSLNDAGNRPPTWGAFLADAYSSLGQKRTHIASALKRFNYLDACDYLKTEYGRESWQDLIREKFVTPAFKSADIHKAIFDLDCRIIASLNFDKIYDAYALKASEGTIVVKNYYDDDVRQTVAGTDRYILKPHGTVDSLSKLIFTTDDYAAARTKHASFYELLTALLHTHTFICIGCGLSDPDIKLIFEDYNYKFSESPHYILLPTPITGSECELIRKTRGLNVLKYSSKSDHAELTASLQSMVSLVAAKRDEIAAQQNW